MIRRSTHKVLFVTVALIGLTSIVACGKAPVQEIESAKLSVAAVVNEGGQQYLPEETKTLQAHLEAALEEVKFQEGSFFKSYDKVTEHLRSVTGEADAAKTALIAKKEALRTKATEDIATAKLAVEDAAAALAKAPAGKGSTEDIEAMKEELAALRDLLREADGALASNDFTTASNHAASITEKATAISTEVATAIAKVSQARSGRRATTLHN